MFENVLRKFILIWLFLFYSAFPVKASVDFTSLNQLLERVETMSPEIQKVKNNLDVVKQHVVQASQIPNPELTVGNWKGRANSQSWKQTDLTITQPLELGGKRGNRIDVAESEIKNSQVELAALVAQIRLKTIFTLYRLRQLNEEIHLIKEAKITFSRLVSFYKKRPQLSPEQSTSLFIFQLAERDYELKIEETNSELNSLDSEIKLLTGYSYEDLISFLPKRIKVWPTLNGIKEINSPSLRMLAAQAELSENELNLAKADAWPTISIGPSFTAQNQFGEKANILGVVVNIPLPILNQNNGAKALALKSIVANRKLYHIEKNVLETRRINLAKTYFSSSKILGDQASENEIYKSHEKIESNFLRGLVSSPLVIEAHRQIFENQKLYHLRELQTLDVYYQLVLLEGGKVEGI